MTANPRNLILNLLLASDGAPMPAREVVSACALFGIRVPGGHDLYFDRKIRGNLWRRWLQGAGYTAD